MGYPLKQEEGCDNHHITPREARERGISYTGALTTTVRVTVMTCHERHCAALHCTALRGTALRCTALHCAALHCAALHCTALCCAALRHSHPLDLITPVHAPHLTPALPLVNPVAPPLHPQISVDVEGVQDGMNINARMGDLPIMVKSARCHLKSASPATLVGMKEEANEMGGYFVMNGIERVIRLLQVRPYLMPLGPYIAPSIACF